MKIILALLIGALNFSCGDSIFFLRKPDNLNVIDIKQQPISNVKGGNSSEKISDNSKNGQNRISMKGHQTVLK